MTSLSPETATGLLVFADGTVVKGYGFGHQGHAVGELCFNTSLTGYQEILTDPSYAGQIITFTFPHIGNVGTNANDHERGTAAARGMVVRERITPPASHRSEMPLTDWMQAMKLVGLSGVDTRALTQYIRAQEAPTCVIAHNANGVFDVGALVAEAKAWPGLGGMNLAPTVSRETPEDWDITRWQGNAYGKLADAKAHIVALDYGAKDNILRCLADTGLSVTILPGSSTWDDIAKLNADGYFLSNGPGDPAAMGAEITVVRDILAADKPVFGICLGHQLLALASGAKTFKMPQGHRGANHPVKDLRTDKVEITSMNHGFAVADDGLPDHVTVTHRSLFDGTICGIALKEKPVFSVQQHPEASPGPMDSYYLFDEFARAVTG